MIVEGDAQADFNGVARAGLEVGRRGAEEHLNNSNFTAEDAEDAEENAVLYRI